jgi:hypothetical protein
VYIKSNTGYLYKTSLELLILELGIDTDISLINPETLHLLATESLIKSTCQFLLHHQLKLKHDINLDPLREGDQALMRIFLALSPTQSEIIALNKCRLYLRVYFLSEICTGDGLEITDNAWRGELLDVPLRTLSWPRQQRPVYKDWVIWKSFLKRSVLLRGLKLRRPLGNWIRHDKSWEWYFSPSEGRLFKSCQGSWESFPLIIKRDRLPAFSNQGKSDLPPSDICRASVYFHRTRIICSGYAPIRVAQAPRAEFFLQHLQMAAQGERWCFSHLDMEDDGQIIALAIQQGEAIAISDGSFQDIYGTAAWVVEGTDSNGRALGAVVVPGSAKDQSAYRSELAGLYSILVFVKQLCEFYQISSGSIELGCDGQSALDKAFNYVSLIRVEDANHDLLQAIRTLWAYSPIVWRFKHVKGHQDDHNALERSAH